MRERLIPRHSCLTSCENECTWYSRLLPLYDLKSSAHRAICSSPLVCIPSGDTTCTESYPYSSLGSAPRSKRRCTNSTRSRLIATCSARWMASFFLSPFTSVRSRMISITSTRFHLMASSSFCQSCPVDRSHPRPLRRQRRREPSKSGASGSLSSRSYTQHFLVAAAVSAWARSLEAFPGFGAGRSYLCITLCSSPSCARLNGFRVAKCE
mmetsp:Transcript_6240/g.15142  ORF Transcript_6240/g.15142 Transcript_6240/m.15142 type:complete len:210 (-) Transcript_6240:1813-2442(-)